MSRFNLHFIRKFHLAFTSLMLVALAIAWFYIDSIKWYELDVRRITLANDVLQSYQEISSIAHRELSALSNRVLLGEGSDLAERGSGASALREAISTLRQDIAEELAFAGGGDLDEQLEPVVEIESLVEEFIRTSERIEQALKEGRAGVARNEMDTFRSSGFADYFNILIAAAVAEQKVKSLGADREATALTRYIDNIMPFLMTALVVITLFFIFILSRRLTGSVNALYQGAEAFRKGNLEYRIPKLKEFEFRRLAESFNSMAIQLSRHRKELRDSNVQLEATVGERTRELQDSNLKLAAADVNRRKLLANISHEFRTPLTVIRGEAEIALRGAGKTREDQQESFRRIIDQAKNATELVDDLLFIARADAGEPRLKLSSVTIAEVVESVCQEFSAMAEKKRIKIESDRLAARSVVQGDPGRLRQVFAILMENALRYSNPGGRVEIQVLQRSGDVEIIFRDEGIGLSKEESELAFERFYRAPKAVEQASGTGLGLPVAKAIVEAHNGTISLSGKPGFGATATVVLPVGRPFGIVV